MTSIKIEDHNICQRNYLVPPALHIADLAFLFVNWLLIWSFYWYNLLLHHTKSQENRFGEMYDSMLDHYGN